VFAIYATDNTWLFAAPNDKAKLEWVVRADQSFPSSGPGSAAGSVPPSPRPASRLGMLEGGFGGRSLGFGRSGLRRLGRRVGVFAVRAVVAGLGQFEQRIRFERLAQLHLELDAGQLQEADRLLQLRRQRKLLVEA